MAPRASPSLSQPLTQPVAVATRPESVAASSEPRTQAEPMLEAVVKPSAVAVPVPEPQASTEPPPWEDWPDTSDYADQEMRAAAAEPAADPVPALRALPVREIAEPSARLDMPRAVAPAAVQATPEGDFWLAVVEGLMAQEAITALVRELALQSQLLARDAAQWQLRVERETLNHAASRERLQLALQAAGHGEVKLSVEVGPVTDSPARRLAVKAAEKMLAAQELIQNDPLVQAMVRDFGAKIVPGSIQLI